MPTATKLFDYTTTTPSEMIAPYSGVNIAIPYVKDNTLFALFGEAFQCGFVNLATGARVCVKDAVWSPYQGAPKLIEPFHVKGDKIVARFAYYTETFHIKIRKVTYDLTAQSISSVDEALDVTASDPYWACSHDWVLGGKTYVTAYWATPNILRFVDLTTGTVYNLDLTAWLGSTYRSLICPKVISKGKELEMVIGRYLAGDIHRYVNINTGVGVDLVATGGGSPQAGICTPLRFSDRRLFPVSSNTVEGSTNRIDWYDETWVKAGETTFTDITHPNPRSGAVIAKLTNGNYLLLMNTSAIATKTANFPSYIKLYELNSSTFARVNTWELDNVSTYECWSGMNGWQEGVDILSLPIVDIAKKWMYILGIYMQTPSPYGQRFILYKIDISDLSIDEWNTFLWMVRTASKPKLLEPKFFDYMNVKVDLDELRNVK
jgi:hypothetical protein